MHSKLLVEKEGQFTGTALEVSLKITVSPWKATSDYMLSTGNGEKHEIRPGCGVPSIYRSSSPSLVSGIPLLSVFIGCLLADRVHLSAFGAQLSGKVALKFSSHLSLSTIEANAWSCMQPSKSMTGFVRLSKLSAIYFHY